MIVQVTQANEDNQVYLCSAGGAAARSICFVLRAWIDAAYSHPAHRAPLLDAALPALKVLLNLSHSFGSTGKSRPYALPFKFITIYETCNLKL